MKKPEVTVLMTVYNGEKYLRKAVDSILNQTFIDFEFLIIDDASTDGSLEILRSFDDPRICIFCNQNNIGLVKSLNKGLKIANGEYIARMDQDDISMPERLEKQVSFMNTHHEIGVCGTWVEAFGIDKKSVWSSPTKHDKIFTRLLFRCSLFHPTVIIRKNIIFTLNEFYNEEFIHTEDYEFWARLGLLGVKFANIDEVLLKYRLHTNNTSIVHNIIQKKTSDKIRMVFLDRLGIQPTEYEFILQNILKDGHSINKKDVKNLSLWLNKIKEANEKTRIFPEPALSEMFAKRWFSLCYNSCYNGPIVWMTFNKTRFSQVVKLTLKQKIKFFIKSLFHVH